MAGNIVFYHTHKQDTGHTTHLVRIISALNRMGVRPVVFQGGLPQPYFEKLADARWIHLPHPFYSREGFDRQNEAVCSAERTAFMLGHMERLKPAVFVTSFFPLGRLMCRAELLPVIKRLRRAGTKIVCSSALPYFSHPQSLLGQLFDDASLYDTFLFHCPAELDPRFMAGAVEAENRISRAAFENALSRLAPKTIFTGYVMDADLPKPGCDPRGPVLVQRGGGAVSFPLLLNAALAARFVPEKRFIIAAGYASTDAELSVLNGLVQSHRLDNVEVRRFIPDLFAEMGCAALVAGTAGGTVYEQLYHGVPSVLAPFEGSSSLPRSDQSARARLLAALCGASLLPPDGGGPLAFAGAVRGRLAARLPNPWGRLCPDWFRGAEISALRLTELLG